VNWFTQWGGASVIGIGYARSCAPILFGGSAAHGGDHPDSRAGFRDFGGVPHRMIFQEAQTDHEIRPAQPHREQPSIANNRARARVCHGREWFGETGIVVAAALVGFVDTHSAAIAVASLVASGKMSAADAVAPILAGLSTNTISKVILAGISGGRSFALCVIPGLIAVALAAWAGALSILISG
jgi:uncharacterized protein DUF4010